MTEPIQPPSLEIRSAIAQGKWQPEKINCRGHHVKTGNNVVIPPIASNPHGSTSGFRGVERRHLREDIISRAEKHYPATVAGTPTQTMGMVKLYDVRTCVQTCLSKEDLIAGRNVGVFEPHMKRYNNHLRVVARRTYGVDKGLQDGWVSAWCISCGSLKARIRCPDDRNPHAVYGLVARRPRALEITPGAYVSETGSVESLQRVNQTLRAEIHHVIVSQAKDESGIEDTEDSS